MTNEYKLNLLKYLTGKINKTENPNIPVFNQEVKSYNNNLLTFINNNLTGTLTSYKLIMLQGKDGTGKDLESFIIVGTETISSLNYGFIVLLDKDLNPIQMIKSYTSGVRLGEIYSIKVANDGTFYFVEYTHTTNKLRLVLVNNILIKSDIETNYFCKLRISYDLPNNMQGSYNAIEVFKNSTGSHYGFILMASEELIIGTLKIQVGEENEWQKYNYNILAQFGSSLTYEAGFCLWQKDNFIFECMASPSSYGNRNIYRFYFNSSNQITYDTINMSSYVYTYSIGHYSIQILGLKHEIVGVTNIEENSSQVQTGHCKYSIVEINNTTITQISSKTSNYSTQFQYVEINLIYKNGTIFFFSYYPTSSTANLDYGLVFNGNTYYDTIQNLEQNIFYYLAKTFAITIQYNLIKYIMPMKNYAGLYVGTQIFNINNYNGSSYEQTKSVLPNSANLYDENNDIIFSRNLYNKSSYENVTLSTLQVPNTMLNDKSISKNQLISYNNNVIIDDIYSDEITKNIYETLNINYYNSLTMWNGNYDEYVIDNPVGAKRLNLSANSLQDLENAKATKVKINFDDESSQILTIDPATQITFDGNVATYTFTIYSPSNKNIIDIDIISNDENTIYQTIEGTFGNDKYYSISQKVECI